MALTLSCQSKFPENDQVLYLPFPAFSLSILSHSYLKQFSTIIFSFAVLKIPSLYKEGRIRFNCRLQRSLAFILFWVYSLNIFLVIMVNPSLLNPDPQHLCVAYQNVQGLIPFGQLSSNHPILDRGKISELQSFASTSKPDIIALNET
jgi:hypothetical protein